MGKKRYQSSATERSIASPRTNSASRLGYFHDFEDDNNILHIACHVNADFIITGDSNLLVLKKYKETKSVSLLVYNQCRIT